MRVGRAVSCLALVLAGIAVAGCTAVPGGPALWGSDGRDADTLCSAVATGEPMLVADVLTAPPSSAIEVLQVDAVDPEDVRVTEISIAPLEPDSASIGNSPVPPPDEFTASIWNARVPAPGYELAAGERADVLVVAERTTDGPGSIATIRIRYNSGGIVYEKSATTFYLFDQACPE